MVPWQSQRLRGRRLSQHAHSPRPHRSTHSSRHGLHDPLGPRTNTLHALFPPPLTGWAAIEKALDDFDNQEMEGVKNDIDTLLVFIGLFSAILSAFVVVSYGLLQEDIPAATLSVLRQISTQNTNYTIHGDVIYSTAPAPDSTPTFEPTDDAIRVNVLWFASLIISLATASFGILVKQWLRQYLRFFTSFPQGRLRVRNFRRSGFESWHVLGIAAFLPFLLQVALGLFFVGLCFFTADVHPSVRNTSVPLVAGWAFILLFVTISPVFSARCPYQTPALNSLISAIRAAVRKRWISAWKRLYDMAHSRWQSAPYGGTVEKLAKAVENWAKMRVDRFCAPDHPHDEAAAAGYEAADLDILADADALQGNDDILGTAMVEALQQSQPGPQAILTFTLKILQHRVRWDGDFPGKPRLIDCQTLTVRALNALQSILEHLPIDDVLSSTIHPTDALDSLPRWVVFLYLSLGAHHGFDTLPPSLWKLLEEKPALLLEISISRSSAVGLRALLRLTCQYCQESQLNAVQSFRRVESVLTAYFRKLELPPSFAEDCDNAPWRSVLNKESLADSTSFLTELLGKEVDRVAEWSETHLEALSFAVKLIAIGDRRQVFPWQLSSFDTQMPALSRVAFSSQQTIQTLLRSLIEYAPSQLYGYLLYSNFGMNAAALSSIKTAIGDIAAHTVHQLTMPSALTVCESIAHKLWDIRHDISSADTDLIHGWRGIFAALTRLLAAAPPVTVEQTDDVLGWINACHSSLSWADKTGEDPTLHDPEKYASWRAKFKSDESPVPDGFYVALLRLSEARTTRHWRVRRLQDMTVEEREEAGKDVEPYLCAPRVEAKYESLDPVGDANDSAAENGGTDAVIGVETCN